MLHNLKEKVVQNTEVIDTMISRYFANRLGVKDIKTINALGKDGKLSFKQKADLFCDIVHLSKIDKAKFKIFIKINHEFILNEDPFSKDNDINSLGCYSPFLFNVYLSDNDLDSVKEKLNVAIDQLVDDVVNLTTKYVNQPQVYYNKKVGILLPE